jgi:HAMP domain-containing protein
VLLVASLCLASVVTFVVATQRTRLLREEWRERAVEFAGSIAAKAGPLLERGDDLRLSILAAGTADGSGNRILVLDGDGGVRIDTGISLAGSRLELMTVDEIRVRDHGAGEGLEVAAPVRAGGEVLGEIRVRPPELKPASETVNLVAQFLLVLLGLLVCSGLALAAMGAMLRPIRELSLRMRRMAAGEAEPPPTPGGVGEAAEITSSFRLLVRNLRHERTRIEAGFVELARQMVRALEARDVTKRGHGERVRRYSMRMADKLGLLPEDRRELELAATLHDVGKPPRIVSMPTRELLFDEGEDRPASEDDHATHAAGLLAGVPGLGRVALFVKHHHERFDGNGGPEGLRGERIPLASRIIAISDTYDNLTHGSPPVPWDEALDHMQEFQGTALDPWLLDLFQDEIRKEARPRMGESQPVLITAHTGEGNGHEDAPAEDVQSCSSDERPDEGPEWPEG